MVNILLNVTGSKPFISQPMHLALHYCWFCAKRFGVYNAVDNLTRMIFPLMIFYLIFINGIPFSWEYGLFGISLSLKQMPICPCQDVIEIWYLCVHSNSVCNKVLLGPHTKITLGKLMTSSEWTKHISYFIAETHMLSNILYFRKYLMGNILFMVLQE